MRLTDHLIVLARAYTQATGLKTTTLSYRVFDDTKKLGSILAGSDIQTGRYEKAMQWFSDNWPQDLTWPEEIARPTAKVSAG